MICKLRCNNQKFDKSEYCFKHLYWSDLNESSDIDNLTPIEVSIKNAISARIKLYLDSFSKESECEEKAKIAGKLYGYLIHKKFFISKAKKFKDVCISKAKELYEDSDNNKFREKINNFLDKYDK